MSSRGRSRFLVASWFALTGCAAGTVDDGYNAGKTDSGGKSDGHADTSSIDDATGDTSSPPADTAVDDGGADTGKDGGGTCDSPKTICGGVCTDTSTDAANCGTCGISCPSGVCAAGKCGCAAPAIDCSGSCVDTSTDPANCGVCGTACATTETCSAGSCVCKTGLSKCGTACVDLTTDASHCGACGTVCTGGATCVGSVCVGGTAKCNATPYKVLFYGPVGSTESTYLPSGSVTTIATDTTWKAMTTASFKGYSLIIIGSPTGGATSVATQWDGAFATRATWGPAITGRVVATTLDPSLHSGVTGATTFLKAALQWAASGPGTGLFVGPDYGRRKLDFMSTFGSWTVLGQLTDSVYGDACTINSSAHGTMTGSSGASLSSWGYSYHGAITAFPTGFYKIASATSPSTQGLVIANDKACTP